MNLNLSKDLRKKQKKRSLQAKKGDKVKIMRGKFKGEVGKILEVNLKSSKIIVEGIQAKKQDGSKVNLKLQPSNLQIIELFERLKKTQTEKKIIEPKKEQAITDSKKPEIQKKEVQKVKKEKTELKDEQKTYPKEGHKGNFLTNSPKRGRVKEIMEKYNK